MFIDQEVVSLHLRQLADELKTDYSAGEIKLQRYQRTYKINLYPPVITIGSKPPLRIPAYFEIKTPIFSDPVFMIRKNNIIDWISEHIFFQHDFQTGDNIFDSEYFIKVDNPTWALTYFSPDVKSYISSILTSGFDRVISVENELKADLTVKTAADCPSHEIIELAMKMLSYLAALTSVNK